MKTLAFLLAALSFGIATLGQELPEAAYRKQYVLLHRALSQNPDDIGTLVALADFYSSTENPQCNLPLAYDYICRAESLYAEAVQDRLRHREVRRLIRDGITVATLRQEKKDIEARAAVYVRSHLRQMRPFETTAFLRSFSDNKEVVRLLHDKALTDAFEQAREEHTVNGYYTFAQEHPFTPQAAEAEEALAQLAPRYFSTCTTTEAVDSAALPYPGSKAIQTAAMRQQSRIAYSQAVRTNTIASYSDYLEQFPRGDHYMEALNQLEQLRNTELNTLSAPEELADFAERHNDNPIADSAMALLRKMIVEQRSQTAALLYLSRFPLDPYHTDIYKEFYGWHAEEGNRQPIADFAAAHPDYPFGLTVKSDLSRGEQIDRFDLTKPFDEADYDTMATVIRLLTGRKTAFVALQRILQQQIARQAWAAALQRLENFEVSFEVMSQEEYGELSDLLRGRYDGPTAEPFFTAGDIDNAVVAPGGEKLYFTTLREGRKTLCFARRNSSGKKGWSPATAVTLQGTQKEAVPYCLYDNGMHALLGIDGDIWKARVVNDTLWIMAERLPAPVNTPHLEMDAFMLNDGSGILLASDRPGGHNVQQSGSYYHGDHQPATDIYFIPYNKGRWGRAENLGMNINSAYCEHSPLLSRNMRTLYFITDARGLGYGDIYYSTREDVNDWHRWSKPKNLGRGINGAFEETSLSFGRNEQQIVFTSRSPKGNRGIAFAFPTQHDTNDSHRMVQIDLSTVSEVARQARLAKVSSQAATHRLSGTQIRSVQNYRLPRDEEYAVLVSADWLYVPTLLIPKDKSDTVGTGYYRPQGYSLEELLALEKALPLPLVQFQPGTARLLPLAEAELGLLGHYLLQRTACSVEIAVHVDGVDDRDCYRLSLERCRAIRTFLVAYGVEAARIRLLSYGNAEQGKNGHADSTTVRFL